MFILVLCKILCKTVGTDQIYLNVPPYCTLQMAVLESSWSVWVTPVQWRLLLFPGRTPCVPTTCRQCQTVGPRPSTVTAPPPDGTSLYSSRDKIYWLCANWRRMEPREVLFTLYYYIMLYVVCYKICTYYALMWCNNCILYNVWAK